MSVPARKKSRSSVRRRRSHHHLNAQNLDTCKKCGAPVQSHRACAKCGFYKDRQVLDTNKQVERAVKKAAAAAHDHDHDHDHAEEAPAQEAKTEEKAS